MVTYNMEIKNAGLVLTNLLTAIHSMVADEYLYVSRTTSEERSNHPAVPSSLSAFGIKEWPLPDILSVLGIRSLTFNSMHNLEALSRLDTVAPVTASEKQIEEFFKKDEVITELRSVFANCRIIAFDDWAAVSGASALWDGLLTNVIKPLGKTDMEFIFYLGDPVKKFSFEVDEALDIISAFSTYGKATFALDENEAINLWMILNGVEASTEVAGQFTSNLKKKYFSIFRTMNIARLLVYSANDAVLYADDEQFVLSRKKVDRYMDIAPDARQNFIAGFAIGLLMRLDMAHCIALGLIVFGCCGELKSRPEQKDLISYIEGWILDLQKPESIQLYQD
ncbi:MAG: hypothetical protein JSU01_07365 [Bacteroidetes bacterium]|nr:hypothetical protein [Bacteroidota bacterium]